MPPAVAFIFGCLLACNTGTDSIDATFHGYWPHHFHDHFTPPLWESYWPLYISLLMILYMSFHRAAAALPHAASSPPEHHAQSSLLHACSPLLYRLSFCRRWYDAFLRRQIGFLISFSPHFIADMMLLLALIFMNITGFITRKTMHYYYFIYLMLIMRCSLAYQSPHFHSLLHAGHFSFNCLSPTIAFICFMNAFDKLLITSFRLLRCRHTTFISPRLHILQNKHAGFRRVSHF